MQFCGLETVYRGTGTPQKGFDFSSFGAWVLDITTMKFTIILWVFCSSATCPCKTPVPSIGSCMFSVSERMLNFSRIRVFQEIKVMELEDCISEPFFSRVVSVYSSLEIQAGIRL